MKMKEERRKDEEEEEEDEEEEEEGSEREEDLARTGIHSPDSLYASLFQCVRPHRGCLAWLSYDPCDGQTTARAVVMWRVSSTPRLLCRWSRCFCRRRRHSETARATGTDLRRRTAPPPTSLSLSRFSGLAEELYTPCRRAVYILITRTRSDHHLQQPRRGVLRAA